MLYDYKEYSISIDGIDILFFFNSGLTLNSQPRATARFHSHYHNELFTVIRGEMIIVTEEGNERILPGDTVLVPAGLVHKTEYSDDIFRTSFAFLKPEGGHLSGFLGRMREISESDRLIRYKSSHFSDTINHILRYVHGDYEFRDRLVKGCLYELAALICHPGAVGVAKEEKNLSDSRNYRNYVINALFENAFSSKALPLRLPTLDELSAYLHLSKKQVDRTVRAFFGKSFGEQMLHLKMKKAKELLEGTEMTVNAISSAVGYSVTRSFFSAFKKEFGMTPGEYRRSLCERK